MDTQTSMRLILSSILPTGIRQQSDILSSLTFVVWFAIWLKQRGKERRFHFLYYGLVLIAFLTLFGYHSFRLDSIEFGVLLGLVHALIYLGVDIATIAKKKD